MVFYGRRTKTLKRKYWMIGKGDKTTTCGRLINDLSGLDPKLRQSSKLAAGEIVRGGAELYDIVFKAAISGTGYDAARCAEACARAAAINPEIAKKSAKKLASSIIRGKDGEIRYYLSVILIYVDVAEKQAKKCAFMIATWLKEETGRGARAAFLETIAYLSFIDPELKPLASTLLGDALKSPIPSYAARARQIMMRKGK
jgi:hypothetical protein